ncbi:MAG TPA: OmpA family protein, partial [Myxococcota bacterium]
VDGALRPRLLLVASIDAGPKPLAWQIVVERMPAGAPVWIFAGRGAPPDRILFDGRDAKSGAPVLSEGNLYRATLSMGFEGGGRASSAPRIFGVRVGASTSDAAPVDGGTIDSDGGELFSAAGKPTQKLIGWLGGHVAQWKGHKITVLVHSDDTLDAAASITAQRAAAVKKDLVGFGMNAADIEQKGAGDAFPVVPNLRPRDRAKNRRVEVLVEAPKVETLPPIAPASTVAQVVKANGTTVSAEDGSFASDVMVPAGSALSLELASTSGARSQIVRGDAPTAAKVEPADSPLVAVVWRPEEHRLVLGEREVSTGLLDVRVAAKKTAVGAVVASPSAPALDVSTWTLRVIEEKPSAPVFADDDATLGTVVREISGDGKLPAEIPWDGNDRDGKRVNGKVRLRLIVKTASGDVGMSPDSALESQVAVAGASNDEVIADPVDAAGALSPAAVEKLKKMAAAAKDATAVHIEVHSDDSGARMDRRSRTQSAAEAMKQILVDAGVAADKISALGMGSDQPLVPNVGKKARAQNRRAEIKLTAPPPVAASIPVVEPSLTANGTSIAGKDGSWAGVAPATTSGDVVVDVRDASGARATLHLRPHGAEELWQGPPEDFAAFVNHVAPLDLDASATPTSATASAPPAT